MAAAGPNNVPSREERMVCCLEDELFHLCLHGQGFVIKGPELVL